MISSGCGGCCARRLPTHPPSFRVLGCSSLPMPCWTPALQPSGLCTALHSPTTGSRLEWNSSLICIYFMAESLFSTDTQCRVTEVVNHITAVSLSSEHSCEFLSCVFCTGNYRQAAHRTPVCAAGLSLWATSSQHLTLSSGTTLCSGAKQEYLFPLYSKISLSLQCIFSSIYGPFSSIYWRALGV